MFGAGRQPLPALQPRPLAAWAPEPATIRLLLAAVPQSVDAMAGVAKADPGAVEAASRAGRLYVPTRSLPPDSFAVPRPFAPAPISRCDALREAYGVALSASIQAAGTRRARRTGNSEQGASAGTGSGIGSVQSEGHPSPAR